MNKKIKVTYVVFACALGIAFVVFLILYVVHGSNEKVKDERINEASIRSEIRSSIQTLGPDGAYEKTKKEATADVLFAHVIAHIFGEELYRAENVSGVGTCDAELGYGCVHGFMAAAVLSAGNTVVPELHKACTDSLLKDDTDTTRLVSYSKQCEHGLGHGFLEYTGQQKWGNALSLCQDFYSSDVHACAAGVFMQYHFNETGIGASTSSIPVLPVKEYSICTAVPTQFESDCYMTLAQLWAARYGIQYKEFGEYCAGVDTAENQRACYAGIARTITVEISESAMIAQACNLLTPHGERVECISQAALLTILLHSNQKKARDICSFLPKSEQPDCLQGKTLYDPR